MGIYPTYTENPVPSPLYRGKGATTIPFLGSKLNMKSI